MNPPANAGDTGDMGSIPGLGRFPWRRKWQPTLVFLPGKNSIALVTPGLFSSPSVSCSVLQLLKTDLPC